MTAPTGGFCRVTGPVSGPVGRSGQAARVFCTKLAAHHELGDDWHAGYGDGMRTIEWKDTPA